MKKSISLIGAFLVSTSLFTAASNSWAAAAVKVKCDYTSPMQDGLDEGEPTLELKLQQDGTYANNLAIPLEKGKKAGVRVSLDRAHGDEDLNLSTVIGGYEVIASGKSEATLVVNSSKSFVWDIECKLEK